MSRREGYRFIDKDPIIDVFRTGLQDSGLTPKDVADGSGIAVGTLYNWLSGKTRRPQHATIKFALKEVGITYEPRWTATGKPVFVVYRSRKAT